MHCELCHKDYKRYFKHQKECKPREVDCDTCGTVEQQKLKKHIEEEYDRRGGLKGDDGVFGEYLNRGFVEREERGWTKYYGCNYWNPVQVDNPTIDKLHIFKRAILAGAKYFPFLILFPGRLQKYLEEVGEAELEPPKHWTPFPDALRGGLRAILSPELSDYIAMIPQFDSGYYWRTLDFIRNAREYGIKRAFELGIERENGRKGGLAWKFRTFKWLFLLATPWIKKALNAIDLPELTEDERYFGYRRSGYDFEGVPWKERVEWTEQKDKGNVILGNEINVNQYD